MAAFVVFAAWARFVLMKGGDKVEMDGEPHGRIAAHAPEVPASGVSPDAPVHATK